MPARGAFRSLFVSCALAVTACGAEHIARPTTPAPVALEPGEAIPADLDVVVRIDQKRIRQALGRPALEGLKERAAHGAAAHDAESERLILDALSHADLVVLGLRPGRDARLTDNVLAMSGDFSKLSISRYATEPRFDSGPLLGGAFRVYERPEPKDRSLPARIYTRAAELMVFVSSAELDSMERRLEKGIIDPSLVPEAKGVVSVVARPATLAASIAERSPAAASLLGTSKQLRGVFDLNATRLSMELELTFELEEDAQRAAAAAALLSRVLEKQPGLTGAVARGLHIESVGSVLVARFSLDTEGLARLTLD